MRRARGRGEKEEHCNQDVRSEGGEDAAPTQGLTVAGYTRAAALQLSGMSAKVTYGCLGPTPTGSNFIGPG